MIAHQAIQISAEKRLLFLKEKRQKNFVPEAAP
jgi:hypothetical protein